MIFERRLQLPDGPPIVGRRSALERWCMRLWIAWFVVIYGILTVHYLWPTLQGWRSYPYYVFVGVLLSILLLTAGERLARSRARRRLQACGLLMCPACWHPMVGDGGESVHVHCPECGARASRAYVRGWWMSMYRVETDESRTADE